VVGRASEAVVGSWAKALAAAGMAGQAGGIGGRELGRPAGGYTGAEVREEVVTGFAAGAPALPFAGAAGVGTSQASVGLC